MDTPANRAPQPPLLRGVIRSVKPDRGFGYVIPSEGEATGDLYFYHKWCKNVHLQYLQPGVVVQFRVRPSVRNVGHLEAYEVSLPSETNIDQHSPQHSDGGSNSPKEVWDSPSSWKKEMGDTNGSSIDAILPLFPPMSRDPFNSTAAWTNHAKVEPKLRVNGVVRMRDEDKGFGHISVSAQSGMNTDLFFHYTWCTATPFADLLPGTHVECSFRSSHRKPGHYEAFDIVAIAAKPTNLPAVSVSLRDAVDWIRGRIKMVDRARGFGHIISDDPAIQSDVFFHHTACVAGTIFGDLAVGAVVEFTSRPSGRKIGSYEAPLVRLVAVPPLLKDDETFERIDEQLNILSLV